MSLPRLATENKQFTILAFSLLIIFGATSFFTMPRSEDPQVAPPGTSVIVIYPGATPEDLENLVVDPIEEALNKLQDIKEIRTNIVDGLAMVAIEFLAGSNPDDKYEDVVREVNGIQSQLPTEIMELRLMKWEISDVKILQFALISETASYRELSDSAEELKKQLERVTGIKKVETWAIPKQIVRVAIDPEKMAQMQIPLLQVIGAIQSSNTNIPGGSLDLGAKRFSIQTSGAYKSLDEIRNTIIHARDQKPVYLKDVATVDLGYEEIHYKARYQNRRAVFVTANQKDRTNIFTIKKRVNDKIIAFERQLPASIEMAYVFDQSKSVATRVNGFFSNMVQGIVLVGMIMLLAVGWHAALIVMMAIPISILVGIGLTDLSGYGLQQMTIAALVIALGMLVDNAIVITENISRFLRKGFARKDAAVQASEQVAWAIVSATLTTVLAFIPLIMMRDITGDFIRSMPVTVIYALSASLLVALTLTPLLSSLFLNQSEGNRITWLQRQLNRLIEGPYRRLLAAALAHRGRTMIITTLIFFGSLALFPLIGVSFFPKAEKPQFMINIDTPEGTSLARTEAVATQVESLLIHQSEIKHFAVNIGHGNPRLYYNVIEKQETSTHAQIFVELKKNDLTTTETVVRELRAAFAQIPAAAIEIKEFEQGPPVEAPIAIKIIGAELETLENLARQVENMIRATPGSVNINNPLRTSAIDLHVDINREKAAMLGLAIHDIDRTVRACMVGLNVAEFRDQTGEEYDIVVRLPITDRPTLADFDKIYLTAATGAMVPLKQVAQIRFKAGPTKISHYNLERNVTITADALRGYSVNQLTQQIVKQLQASDWPRGYRFYVGGEQEARQESFGGMSRAAMVALIAIFSVLVLQFRSFVQPIVVFVAIPFALVGALWALFLTGNSFSFTAFVGLTSLVGVVVNTSIILVDYTNQLRRAGKDTISALQEAGETRLTPIFLTTGTTIGGLLPLTLRGGTLWAPMGWTIIGGLVVSTLLTLVLVPVLYVMFTQEKKD